MHGVKVAPAIIFTAEEFAHVYNAILRERGKFTIEMPLQIRSSIQFASC